MSRDPAERWRDLGSFIREQRATARLSLRRLSELAGVSNPYLSQIERGLRRPSADILQQIARALTISAETLYVQAGILDPPGDGTDLVAHIRADPHLTESEKQALVQIYRSFRREHEHAGEHDSHHEHDPHHEHEHASEQGHDLERDPAPDPEPPPAPDRPTGGAR